MAKARTIAAGEASDADDGGLSGVRAVDRALAILQAFTPDEPAMSVLELQQRVGLSRPTLYRLLHTLELRGMIRSEGDPQRFKLSHGIMQLSHVWLKSLDVTSVARPVIEGLRDETGETATLFTLQGGYRICILEAVSRHELAVSRGVGQTLTITAGASGRAILAFLSPDIQTDLINSIPEHERKRVPERVHVLRRAIAETGKLGYATSFGEVIAGSVGVAAPYFNHTGATAGSVGLYGPSARIGETLVPRFGKLVVDAGREISKLLGYSQAV